jgi:glucosamine-6-phosphate deaminase
MSVPIALQVKVVGGAAFGAAAADAVLSALPPTGARLGVATGGTPLLLYRELARRSSAGRIDLRDTTLVALDEYVGLGADDPHSYRAYVRDTIADPLRVDPAAVFVPDGLAADPDREAADFERSIDAIGGVDVQIVGIGSNGHLGFNEPGSSFASTTRTVALSARTRADNARFFGGSTELVPTHAITQGLATICRAHTVVLLVYGASKAPALEAALRGPVDTDVPASVLQRHPRVTVIADHDAAVGL